MHIRLLIILSIFSFSIATAQQGKINESKGDSLLTNDNYQAAAICFKNAALCYDSSSNTKSVISCNNKAALCYSRLGKYTEAKSLLAKDLLLFQQKSVEDIQEEANTYKLLGELALKTADYARALELFQNEQKLFSTGISKAIKAKNLSNLGISSDQIGNHDDAVDYLKQAIILLEDNPDKIELANNYNNLGLIFSADEPKEALDAYSKAIALYKKELGANDAKVINTENNQAIIYRRLDQPGKALNIFENTLSLWKKQYGEQHPSVAFTYSNIGQVYLDFDMIDSALTYEVKALSIYETVYGTHHPDLANTHNHIANIYRTKQDYDKALQSIQKSINSNCKDFTSEDLNDNPTAEVSAFNRQLLAITLHIKAQLFHDLHRYKTLKQGDLKRAFKTLEACDALIDEQRHFLKNKKDKLALGKLAKEVDEDAVTIALAMADNSVKYKKDFLEKAFTFAEKSKASVLLESMNDVNAKSFAKLPQELLEQEKTLIDAIENIQQQLSLGSDNELALRQELKTKRQEHNAFVKTLETEYPEYYDLKYNIKISTINEIQHVINATDVLYSYFINEPSNRLIIFEITKSDFKVHNTPLRADFENQITGYRNSIYYQSAGDYKEAAANLYKQLFPKRIPKGKTKLVIIPDGRLGIIPFEGLLTSKVEGNSYETFPFLINQYATSYAFSATLYYNQLKNKGETKVDAITLTAPITFSDMSTLPGTEKEVDQIKASFEAKGKKTTSFKNKDASETKIKSLKTGSTEILHFATHGIVHQEKPELSQLFLKPDPNNDGNLFTSEIYNMELNASLINLSACETGLGQFSKGEGIVGLSRALIFAGAENLIVSYWSVADESTSKLMIDFYNQFLENNSYAASLREAKLALIKQKEFSAPYFWAPFVLIGK